MCTLSAGSRDKHNAMIRLDPSSLAWRFCLKVFPLFLDHGNQENKLVNQKKISKIINVQLRKKNHLAGKKKPIAFLGIFIFVTGFFDMI
jgi:hypothetical protein